MPRIARIAYAGCPHHITHRGNRREPVFFHDDDRRAYLTFLREDSRRAGLQVWAYCLMPNHVHLIAVGEKADSMARAIGNAHRRYSRLINERHGWTGHLWANRFYSSPLGETHVWMAARYVETNPIRAGLADRPADYPWSSARAHVLGTADPLLALDRPFPGSIDDWNSWLMAGLEHAQMTVLRQNTAAGRPTGPDSFLAEIERRSGRSLAPRRRGRKPTADQPGGH
jgi:REP-associated tyrosine transposase